MGWIWSDEGGFLAIGPPRGLSTSVILSKEDRLLIQRNEAKLACSSTLMTGVAGFVAGSVICLLPLAWLAFNALTGLIVGAQGASLGRWLLPTLTKPAFVFWVIYMGVMGIGSAFARRWSERNGRYWRLYGQQVRFGLDDVLSVIATPFLLAIALWLTGAGAVMYWLLAISPMPGFILHSLWDMLYCPIIYRFCQVTNSQCVQVALKHIKEHPMLREYDLHFSFDEQSGIVRIDMVAQNDDDIAHARRICQNYDLLHLGASKIEINRTAK